MFGYNSHPLCCFNKTKEYFYLYNYYKDKSIGKVNSLIRENEMNLPKSSKDVQTKDYL